LIFPAKTEALFDFNQMFSPKQIDSKALPNPSVKFALFVQVGAINPSDVPVA